MTTRNRKALTLPLATFNKNTDLSDASNGIFAKNKNPYIQNTGSNGYELYIYYGM